MNKPAEYYLIREFENDFEATDFVNQKFAEGYTVVSVSAAAVSSDKDTRKMVPSIVVTLFRPNF